VQAYLFDSGLRQEKAALASTKADFPSLPKYKQLLLSAQKQLLELPFVAQYSCTPSFSYHCENMVQAEKRNCVHVLCPRVS
jgi:hypothetical protein